MKHILTITILILTYVSSAQVDKYFNYSDNKLKIQSEYLRDSISLNIHLPETFEFASEKVKYPVIVIFDSQHEKTYPHIINSIDMLTSESQIPESIIIGVPFSQYNRYYLTSNQKKENDSLMGIERTERFLFDELIPLLNSKYKANDFLSIIGHSRTAFLVNYLTTCAPDKIDIAIAASAFYDNPPVNISGFKEFLKDTSKIKNSLQYYFSAGTSIDDKEYFNQCSEIDEFIGKNSISKKMNCIFIQNPSANHMINYWMTVPQALAHSFDSYNNILSDWFTTKIKDQTIIDPIKIFKNDLNKACNQIGFKVNPSLTQIFSIANAYANEENYNTALKFIEFGLKVYSSYFELNETLIYYKEKLKVEK